MIWKRGSELPRWVQEEILARYPYRWTTGNTYRERMYRNQETPTMPLETDEQWLNRNMFPVTGDGRRLDNRIKHCRPAYMLEDAQ